MDQIRKFGEQTSRILEFKPEGLEGQCQITPLIISLFSSNVLTCDLKMNQFKHKPWSQRKRNKKNGGLLWLIRFGTDYYPFRKTFFKFQVYYKKCKRIHCSCIERAFFIIKFRVTALKKESKFKMHQRKNRIVPQMHGGIFFC